MGFSDYLRFEAPYPEHHIAPDLMYQTKSLYASGAEFTISKDGQLIEHQFRIEEDPDRLNPHTARPLWKRIPIGDRVIDYHGDILLYGPISGGHPKDVVVRFTHGLLEWIRMAEDYPEVNKTLLLEQGAR